MPLKGLVSFMSSSFLIKIAHVNLSYDKVSNNYRVVIRPIILGTLYGDYGLWTRRKLGLGRDKCALASHRRKLATVCSRRISRTVINMSTES